MAAWDDQDPSGPITWPWSPPVGPIDPALAPQGVPEVAPPTDSSVPSGAPPPLPASASAPPVPPGALVPVDASLAGAPAPGVAPSPDLAIPPPPAPVAQPLPDAITGAGGMPATGELGGRPYAPTREPSQLPEAKYRADVAAIGDSPFDDQGNVKFKDPAEFQRYMNELRLRDPMKFADVSFQLGDIKTKHLLAEQHRIADEDYKRQQENLEMRNRAIETARAKSAEIDARAQELANTKIGQLSIGQRLAGVAAAVVGGLYQGKTGSARNPGIDAFNEVINRHIEGEKAQLANQRELLGIQRTAVGEEYARSGDAYQAAEVVRLAALKHADDLLATQQQEFAADGTRGIQIAQIRGGIAAQMAADQQARDQKLFDNSFKVQEAARQQQLANETLRHNRVEEALAWTKEAREGAKAKADNTVLTPAQIRQQFPDYPVSAIPPGGATVADLTKRGELYNKTQETNAKGRENVVNEAATVVRNPITKQPIIDSKTGQPARMRAEAAEKFTGEIGKSQQFMDTLADIKRDLDADPSSFDRAKYAAITAKYERAKVKFIGSADAKPSSREMQAVEEMFGTNFDGFTSRMIDRSKAMSRIDALMDGTQSDVLTDANLKLGYEGAPILRDPRQFKEHQPSVEEQAVLDTATRLKAKPNISYDTALDQAVHFHVAELPATRTAQDTMAAMAAARAEASEYKDISPQQRRDVAALAARALTGDQAATLTLREVAKTSHSKVVRALAQDAFDRARAVANEQTAGDVFGGAIAPQPEPTATYDTPALPPWHPTGVLPTFPGAQ